MPNRLRSYLLRGLFSLLAAAAAGVVAPRASANTVFDFETPGLLEASNLTEGDFLNFEESTAQAHGGTQSLRFVQPGPESFQSFTYSDPTDMTSGTITVWFYDTTGFPAQNPGPTTEWGLSIILEDANNSADFGAIEICNLPYGGQGYYASEGVGDRLKPNDRFYTGLPGPRSIGWHRVDFDVSSSVTLIRVDGNNVIEVAAPGSDKNLRLRIMADSASVGGFDNWFTFSGEGSYPSQPGKVLIDDITFTAVEPAAASHHLDFEVSGSTPDYDTFGEFMGPDASNNPNMLGFINTFDTTGTQTHSGTQSAVFTPGEPALRSVTIDLGGLDSSTTRTVTLYFHDALGADQGFDKVGGSIIVENGSDPSEFIAAEIWNAPYPFGGPVPNYYLTARPVPFGSGFYSGYFGDRSVGWHLVEIILTATESRIRIDGIENANNAGLIVGPGLNSQPRLRIMADSPSMGGFANWKDSATWSDPLSPELNILYLEKTADYLHYDDITLPSSQNAVGLWAVYE